MEKSLAGCLPWLMDGPLISKSKSSSQSSLAFLGPEFQVPNLDVDLLFSGRSAMTGTLWLRTWAAVGPLRLAGRPPRESRSCLPWAVFGRGDCPSTSDLSIDAGSLQSK